MCWGGFKKCLLLIQIYYGKRDKLFFGYKIKKLGITGLIFNNFLYQNLRSLCVCTSCACPYCVGLFVQRLHHHHVPALVDPVDRRLQLHPLPQLLRHALTDLTGAADKLPLLQRTERAERAGGQSPTPADLRFSCPPSVSLSICWVKLFLSSLIQLWQRLCQANKTTFRRQADTICWFILVLHTRYPQSALFPSNSNKRKCVCRAQSGGCWMTEDWRGAERLTAAKAAMHKIKQTVTFSIWLVSASLCSPSLQTHCEQPTVAFGWI